MRLAKRFNPNPVTPTTKVNTKKNEKRIAANHAFLKSFSSDSGVKNSK